MRIFMMSSCLSISLVFIACATYRGPDTPLAAAAAAGRTDEVRELLDQDADPNQGGGRGETPLMVAARKGSLDVIKLLIERGADPNKRVGMNDWTPVMHAIHKRQTEAVEVLLQQGADVNAKTGYGLTALIMAAGDGNLEIVKILLNKGADPYAETHEGITALTMAVSGGAFSDIDRPLLGGCQTAVVRALLEEAPDLKLKGNFATRYALFFANLKGCSEIHALLEKRKLP